MKDYSQHKEQQIILDYFEGHVGALLDCGSNDGVTFSNSRALIEQGWRGDLVEPSLVAFERLWELYKDHPTAYIHRVAIADKTGEMTFYESGSLLNGHDHALVSSLKLDETTRWKTTTKPEHKVVEYIETKVPTITWKDFQQHASCKTYDFITIDVEGYELEILRQMDLRALKVRMICVEHNGKNLEEYDRLIPLPLHYKNRTNAIYAAPKRIILP